MSEWTLRPLVTLALGTLSCRGEAEGSCFEGEGEEWGCGGGGCTGGVTSTEGGVAILGRSEGGKSPLGLCVEIIIDTQSML